MKRVLKGPSRQKYSAKLRCFALTLNFYSAKAYAYVRAKFNNSLPHPATITKWLQSIDGSPGFTTEALQALTIKVQQAKEMNKTVVCNLVMDEIAIRKQIEWTGKKFTGYIDLGTNLDADNLPEAKEALVFMVVAVNDSWKVPVGYFLIDGLCGSEKANLVNKCLEFIHDSGIVISSLTFDGAASNISMAKCLGCNFEDPDDLKNHFSHPVTNANVFILFDICHMLKLIRNCFASMKTLQNGDNNIEWEYLEKLNRLQDDEGLHLGNKLKRRHLQWVREKMKVKIAAQTLSKSVSDAILYLCQDAKVDQFQGAEETAKFILIFNNLFDIFNSRNRLVKYTYKRPISAKNFDEILNYFTYAKNYIFDLKLKGSPILRSARKTGFLGFLIAMQSFKQIYEEFIIIEFPLLKYILTYKFSQDHLEIFFSVIRSRGGHNNNPSARQFESIYRRLLVHSEIRGADSANSIALDSTGILHCSSIQGLTTIENGENLLNSEEYIKICEEIENHDYVSGSVWHLTDFIKDVVRYIAGFIVRALKKCLVCSKCVGMLENDNSLSLLQKRKAYGKMTNASSFVIEICEIAEKWFRVFKNMGKLYQKIILEILILKSVNDLPSHIFNFFGDHLYDDDPLSGHCLALVKLILKKYNNIRIHHETKNKTNNVTRVRSVLTKTILFKNQ